MPALDQAIALPCASVMVIMVLLKLAFTWATPDVMFLRSRFLMRAGACAMSLVPYFFLPAIGFALPLRVRALVWVRWPRTGRARRGGRPRADARGTRGLSVLSS